jgi:hypothetical protein
MAKAKEYGCETRFVHHSMRYVHASGDAVLNAMGRVHGSAGGHSTEHAISSESGRSLLTDSANVT